jgi:hypothetical protein
MIDPHAIEYAKALQLVSDAGAILVKIAHEKRISGDRRGADRAIWLCEQLIKFAKPEVGIGLFTQVEGTVEK